MFVFWISLEWPKGDKSKTKHCGILTRNTPSCSIFKFMSVTLPNMDAQDLKNPQKVLRNSQNWPSQGPKGNEFTWVKHRRSGFKASEFAKTGFQVMTTICRSQPIEFERIVWASAVIADTKLPWTSFLYFFIIIMIFSYMF